MNDREMVARARAIAEEAHAGQVDKAGQPYMGHVQRVAQRFTLHNPELMTIAYLHDVLEDCPAWTTARLLAEGFPEPIVAAVVALTKLPTDAPGAYLARVLDNKMAYTVKTADLLDNLDLSRFNLEDLTVADLRRQRKYCGILAKIIGRTYVDFDQALEAIAKGRVHAVLVDPETGDEIRRQVERQMEDAMKPKGGLH